MLVVYVWWGGGGMYVLLMFCHEKDQRNWWYEGSSERIGSRGNDAEPCINILWQFVDL